MRAIILAALAIPLGLAADAEDFNAWPLHTPRFESTSGGGVMIDDYNLVVIGDRCVTRFTATVPTGQVFASYVLFEARQVPGGILCDAGRWASVNGSDSGTTPYRVFLGADGVARRPPG